MKSLLAMSVAGAIVAFALPTAAEGAGDVARGKTLFTQRCLTCHTVVAGQNKPTGPNLHGIVGRKAGSASGYRYSRAMAANTTIWDAAKLDAFMAAPLKAMPGTAMVIATTNAKDRADLIAYLTAPTP